MKKVLIFLITFLVFMAPVAANPETGAAGASQPGTSQEVTSQGKCQYGSGNYGPVGIRITIVDTNGNRVPGTNSLDFVQRNSYIGVSGSDFQIVSFKPAGQYYHNATPGRSRNENVSNGVTPALVSSGETAYYWSKFPLSSSSFGSSLRSYFVNKFAKSDYNDMLKVFSELRYDISDVEKLKNHYLIVEPLYYFKWDSPIGGCQYETRVYYGTGTEVLAMLKQVDGEKVFTFRTNGGKVYNHAVYHDLGLSAYVPGVDLAGLIHADQFVGNDYAIETAIMQDIGGKSYGLSSMVVWLRDMFVDTPPETCTTAGFKFEPATDCTQSTAGYAGDTNDWGCIFDQLGKPANTYDGQFYNPGGSNEFSGAAGTNPYCTVACREEVFYNFSGKFEVYAGSRFYIQTSNNYMENVTRLGPITMTGVVECRTGKNKDTKANTINVDKFIKDYQTADANVLAAYDDWQNAEAAYEARNHLGVNSWTDSYTNTKGYRIMITNPGLGRSWYQEGYVTNYGEVAGICSAHIANGAGDCRAEADTETTYYTRCRYSGTYTSPTGYRGSMSFDATVALGQGCNQDGNFYGNGKYGAINGARSTADGKRNNYNAKVSTRNDILNKLKDCNNFQRTYSEFTPSISFVYSDSYYKNSYVLRRNSLSEYASTVFYNNGNVTGSMGWGNPSTTNDSKFAKNYGVYGSSNAIHRYDCAGGFQRCTNGAEAYPTNTNVASQTVRSYDFGLPEGVYRYVAKNGVSYNTATEATNSDYPFKDLGQSTLPVRFGTRPGTYDYYLEYYYNGSNGNLFGANQKFYQYNMITSAGSTEYKGLTISTNLSYKCNYEVTQNFLEDDPKDMNAIYRTISLSNPFPGESGNGRLSGSNWIGNVTIFGDKMSYIDAYITNNRGVSGEAVYQEKPMFQFVLSAANMRAIRKYNKELKYDYNDFNLDCEEGGYYCKSRFLQEGIGEGYFQFTNTNSDGGSCFDAAKDTWESCRYTNLGG